MITGVQGSLASLVIFSLLFFLFRFCAVRWVEDRPVAERAIEVISLMRDR